MSKMKQYKPKYLFLRISNTLFLLHYLQGLFSSFVQCVDSGVTAFKNPILSIVTSAMLSAPTTPLLASPRLMRVLSVCTHLIPPH